MFLCGAKAMVRGSGRGLRISYFLTNGNTTVSELFMFKNSGIKGLLRLIRHHCEPRKQRSDKKLGRTSTQCCETKKVKERQGVGWDERIIQ